MTTKLTAAQAMERMTGHYDIQRKVAEEQFEHQLDWLKRDLEGTDPHRLIADIESHLNRLRDYAARIDDAQAKINAVHDLAFFMEA